MDQDLKEYLQAMEQRMTERTDEHLQAMEQRMTDRILERTQEMVRDAQTEILRGFDRYNSSVQIRLRSLESETSNLKTAQELRLANLEERIIALELAFWKQGPHEPPRISG